MSDKPSRRAVLGGAAAAGLAALAAPAVAGAEPAVAAARGRGRFAGSRSD